MKKVLGLCIAIVTVVLLLSACGENLSDEDFVGVWEEHEGYWRIIIHADGTGEYHSALVSGGGWSGEPTRTGEYHVVPFEWEQSGNTLVTTIIDIHGNGTVVRLNDGVLRFGGGIEEFRRAD